MKKLSLNDREYISNIIENATSMTEASHIVGVSRYKLGKLGKLGKFVKTYNINISHLPTLDIITQEMCLARCFFGSR